MDSSTFEVQILPSYRLGKVKILYHLAFHLFRILILMDAQPFYIWYKNKIHLKEPIEMGKVQSRRSCPKQTILVAKADDLFGPKQTIFGAKADDLTKADDPKKIIF